MSSLSFSSITVQVAAHLRAELLRRRWSGTMPGRNWLAEELGVSRKTVQGALVLLENEGVLAPQGPGRPRRIVLKKAVTPPTLRVAILLHESIDRNTAHMVDLLHELDDAGHSANFASKSLLDLGMDVKRIARMVKQTEADAWVVAAGSSEVLEWFVAQTTPAFALFGRRRQVAIAATGPNKVSAYAKVARELHQLGHRRIVMLGRKIRRLPGPGAPERAFLKELETHGQTVGSYNLPDWKDNMKGFQNLLTSLFQVTPPTALMIDEPYLFIAVQQFLNQRGIRTPENVSLVCSDNDPVFVWCHPSIAHISWNSRPMIRSVLRWAANVSRGKKDIRQTLTPAKFVAGGTVGPVPR